ETIRLWSAFSSLMSTPAQKPRPSARITITRTAGSSPSAAMRCASAFQPAALSALTGGRFSTTSATPSSCTWLVNGSDMGFLDGLRRQRQQFVARLARLRNDASDPFAAALQPVVQVGHLAGRHGACGWLAFEHSALQ